MRYGTLRERLLSRAIIDFASDCWLWSGSLRYGYGQIYVRTPDGWRNRLAHRIAYEMLDGPIPEGLQLDHLCRRRSCINPAHLEPVTNRENTLRGLAPETNRKRLRARTACKNGHPFSETNTTVLPNGRRQCRACNRKSDRRNRGYGARGPRRQVVEWITSRRALAECGHEVVTKNGRKPSFVLCIACDDPRPALQVIDDMQAVA